MKILIAEDDVVTREILKRLLSHFADKILEAEDGIVALELIEREDPDVLVTDLNMPGLDGESLIRAVRAGKNTSMMPVICTSASRDRDEIVRLAELRISDYILKPFRPQDVHDRFRKVLERAGAWRKRQGADDGNPIVLLVDPDPNFREFARPFLEAEAQLLEVASGAAALRAYREAELKPGVVIVAEGLPMLREDQLVQLIGRLAEESGVRAPMCWLVSDEPDAVDLSAHPRFAGVMQRVFIPDSFVAELRRSVLGRKSATELLRDHLAADARKWLVTATRQTLGVMSGQEVTTIAGEGASIAAGVCGRITLTNTEARVSAIVACAKADAEQLATKVLRREATFENGAADVFGELSNTIGGRARVALIEKGFDLQISIPEIDSSYTTDTNEAWDVSAWFSTAQGSKFFVGFRSESPTGDGVGVGAVDVSIDDALF